MRAKAQDRDVFYAHTCQLYTEDIMRNVSNDERQTSYDEVEINDDTALFSTTNTDLNKLVESTKEHSEDKQLMPNI